MTILDTPAVGKRTYAAPLLKVYGSLAQLTRMISTKGHPDGAARGNTRTGGSCSGTSGGGDCQG